MNSLNMKICELKKNLMDINIKAIKKDKSKTIKLNSNNNEEIHLLQDYNYNVKLIKRLKKYISQNLNSEIILKMMEDKFSNIICIVINIKTDIDDIGVPLEIEVITGNDCGVLLSCTYYNKTFGGMLYLNDFRSYIPQKGYGSTVLKNLDEIIFSINKVLIAIGYDEIVLVEGIMTPNTNMISKEDLMKLYLKFGFSIDSNNKMKRFVENKSLKTYSY